MQSRNPDSVRHPQPKLSVIIPVYNVEPYLRRCLDSVFAQTIAPEIEIICIDDGSTDGSPSILEEYNALHANLVRLRQENAGASVARNRGLDAATGEYIFFMDSDDWLYRADALELLYARAVELNLDELIFYTHREYETEALKARERHPDGYKPRRKYAPDLVLSGQDYFLLLRPDYWPVALWHRIYRREFLAENHLRFIPGIVYEDRVYSSECILLTKRVAYYDLCCYTYFVRESSVTQSTQSARKPLFKSTYSRLTATRHIAEFTRRHSATASPKFKRIFRQYNGEWKCLAASSYLQYSRKERAEFWQWVPADARAQLRRDLRQDVVLLRRQQLKRWIRRRIPKGLKKALKKHLRR